MAKITERVYTIPLRKKYLKAPRYKRAKKSAKIIREFIEKHVGEGEVKISEDLNQQLWERGGKKVPPKVKVLVKKEDEEITVSKYEEESSS